MRSESSAMSFWVNPCPTIQCSDEIFLLSLFSSSLMDLQLGAIIHWWPHFACLRTGVGWGVLLVCWGVGGGGLWASEKCAIAIYWSLLKRRKCIWTGERVHPFLFPLRFLIWHLIPSSAFQSGDKLEQATPDWIKSSLIKLYRARHIKKHFLEWILWQVVSVIVWLGFMACVAIMKLSVKWFWTPLILCVGIFEYNMDNCLLSLLS